MSLLCPLTSTRLEWLIASTTGHSAYHFSFLLQGGAECRQVVT